MRHGLTFLELSHAAGGAAARLTPEPGGHLALLRLTMGSGAGDQAHNQFTSLFSSERVVTAQVRSPNLDGYRNWAGASRCGWRPTRRTCLSTGSAAPPTRHGQAQPLKASPGRRAVIGGPQRGFRPGRAWSVARGARSHARAGPAWVASDIARERRLAASARCQRSTAHPEPLSEGEVATWARPDQAHHPPVPRPQSADCHAPATAPMNSANHAADAQSPGQHSPARVMRDARRPPGVRRARRARGRWANRHVVTRGSGAVGLPGVAGLARR